MEENSDEEETFSHKELVEFTTKALNELLSKDSFMCDLPPGVTLDEIKNETAVLYGQSMTIVVEKDDGTSFRVIVPQSKSRVFDLKKAIQRALNLKLQREGTKKRRRVSWRYVWRTYNLSFDGILLEKGHALLSEFGICHKSVIHFVKKRRVKFLDYV